MFDDDLWPPIAYLFEDVSICRIMSEGFKKLWVLSIFDVLVYDCIKVCN